MNNEQTTIISIAIITYNQEDFIKQTLDSILKQKTKYPLEVIIGEDCSTDNTRKICEEYASKDQRIKVLESSQNIGMMKNFIRTLNACSGKYIAYCEADDYWTDENKLNKQVDFLETNQDFVAAFHDISVIRDHQIIEERRCNYNKDVFTFEDIAKSNPITTLSLVFKNIFIHHFPEWIIKCKVADYPLALALAEHGKFKYFNEVMGVYRHQASGSFFNLTKKDWISKVILPTYQSIFEHLETKNKKYIYVSILREKLQLYKIQKQFLRYLLTNIRLIRFRSLTGYNWKDFLYLIKDYFNREKNVNLNE